MVYQLTLVHARVCLFCAAECRQGVLHQDGLCAQRRCYR